MLYVTARLILQHFRWQKHYHKTSVLETHVRYILFRFYEWYNAIYASRIDAFTRQATGNISSAAQYFSRFYNSGILHTKDF